MLVPSALTGSAREISPLPNSSVPVAAVISTLLPEWVVVTKSAVSLATFCESTMRSTTVVSTAARAVITPKATPWRPLPVRVCTMLKDVFSFTGGAVASMGVPFLMLDEELPLQEAVWLGLTLFHAGECCAQVLLPMTCSLVLPGGVFGSHRNPVPVVDQLMPSPESVVSASATTIEKSRASWLPW